MTCKCSISYSEFLFSIRRRHTRCALVTGVQTCALPILQFSAEDVGRFDIWAAQTTPGACFSFSVAVSSSPMPGRKAPRLAVTDHLNEKLFNTVTVGSGFADASGATATISVDGGQEFKLLPFNGSGFVSSRLEPALIDAFSHRSEAHTSEPQSLMRHSYAVFCLK